MFLFGFVMGVVAVIAAFLLINLYLIFKMIWGL